MFWRKKKTNTTHEAETKRDHWDSPEGAAIRASVAASRPALAAEVERGRNRVNKVEDDFPFESPLEANPGAFRSATVAEYRDWLRTYLRNGGTPTNYLDQPMRLNDVFMAVKDFHLSGAYGTDSIEAIVPEGVEYIVGDLGHCTLYLPSGETSEGPFPPTVVVYNDPELMSLPNMRKFAEEKQREKAERRAARRREMGYDDEAPESTPLHAHEVTADDAAMIRMMSGAHFGDSAAVTLPSGKTITGAEMRRWIEAQDG